MNEVLNELQNYLTEEEAKQLVSKIQNCDKYLAKFKKDLTPILTKLNKEVLVGIQFKEKD